jgi:hypothetical protein
MEAFLSSTYRDLSEHRQRAADALDRLGHHVLRMETFGSRPDEPTTASLSEVEACDLFLGIYAHRYGYIPPGSEISITEQEFVHARAKSKPIFTFFVDPDYIWPDQDIEPEPGKTKLVVFGRKIAEGLVRDLFTTPEDLAVRIATSVSRFLQRRAPALAGIQELAAVLELRKDAIIRMMEDAKQSALKSFRSGDGRRTEHASEEELVSHLDAIRSLFLQLHRQNVDALLSGQIGISHELTAQIHTLLWVRKRNTFWSAHAWPNASYKVNFDSEEAISVLYPHDPLDMFDRDPKAPNADIGEGFLTARRIHETNAALQSLDPLNSQRQRERALQHKVVEKKRIDEEQKGLLEIDGMRGTMDALVRPDGWTTCPFCKVNFLTSSGRSWDGKRHRTCRTRLNLIPRSEG